MERRNRGILDRLLSEADHGLRTVAARPHAHRCRPDQTRNEAAVSDELNPKQARLSARLMRVNHAGEIAAQALYRGQALVATDPTLRQALLQSADDEHDHLAWCQDRAEELGGRTSLLTPLWYAGSFAIGAAAGLTGDRNSLGFLEETEQQVAEHLDTHLQQLPAADQNSRQILSRMREDELEHAHKARALGSRDLPQPAKKAMRLLSKVMTTVSFRI